MPSPFFYEGVFIIKNKLVCYMLSFFMFFKVLSFPTTVKATVNTIPPKEEKVVGALVSIGLGAVGAVGVKYILTTALLGGAAVTSDHNARMTTYINNYTDQWIADNQDLVNKDFGASIDGKIAASWNAIKKFRDDFFTKSNNIKENTVLPNSNDGYVVYGEGFRFVNTTNEKLPIYFKSSEYDTEYGTSLSPGSVLCLEINKRDKRLSYGLEHEKLAALNEECNYIVDNAVKGIRFKLPNIVDFGGLNVETPIKTPDFTYDSPTKGDFIVNPTWNGSDVLTEQNMYPPLPWQDTQNTDRYLEGSIGGVGVLNPDGTISIPDIGNPDIPDIDEGVDEDSKPETGGILGWLSNFWENLWNFLKEFVKFLFYPTSAISAWNGLKDTLNNNFKFIEQLNGISWSTNNNQRLKIPFSYAKTTTYITIPDYIEYNYVSTFRNLFKYFIYGLTLFVCVQILRPKFTVGTR